MTKTQRIIVAIGLVCIVALGLWPPFQSKGGQYEGQHFLLDDSTYAFARIDLARLGIGWLSIVLIFGIVLLLYKSISLRAVKILALTVGALLLIAATCVLVVKQVRRHAHVALIQQARQDMAAVTLTSRPDGSDDEWTPIEPAMPKKPGRKMTVDEKVADVLGKNAQKPVKKLSVDEEVADVLGSQTQTQTLVLNNPTKWELSAEGSLGSSFSVEYITAQHVLLFSASRYRASSLLRAQSQDILENVAPASLSREQQSRLPQKSPFIQRVTLKYNRATMGNQAVELDPPFELVLERFFVFYPEEWGWYEPLQWSYLRGPAEFKEVSPSTQHAPPRRLAGPPPSFSDFEWTPIEPLPMSKQHGATRK